MPAKPNGAGFRHWSERIMQAHGPHVLLLALRPAAEGGSSRNVVASLACRRCGHRWQARAQDCASGRGCRRCGQTRAEDRIASLLEDLRIPHRRNRKLSGSLGPLAHLFPGGIRPDFELLDRPVVIEYDGEGHYHNVMFGAKKRRRGTADEGRSHRTAAAVQTNDLAKDIIYRSRGLVVWRVPYFWGQQATAVVAAALKGDPLAQWALRVYRYRSLVGIYEECS